MVLFLDRVSNIDETVKAAFIEITQNKKKKKKKRKYQTAANMTLK